MFIHRKKKIKDETKFRVSKAYLDHPQRTPLCVLDGLTHYAIKNDLTISHECLRLEESKQTANKKYSNFFKKINNVESAKIASPKQCEEPTEQCHTSLHEQFTGPIATISRALKAFQILSLYICVDTEHQIMSNKFGAI